MKFFLKLFTVLLLTIFLGTQLAHAQEKPNFLHTNTEKQKILLLGVFHFANPGKDVYKPKYEVNIFSKRRQKQVKKILHLLKKYHPTKIAVEINRKPLLRALYPRKVSSKAESQKSLDSLYQAYLTGIFKAKNSYIPKSSEVYQLGFRLGKLTHQKTIYAVNAWSAPFFTLYIREHIDDLRNAFSRAKKLKWQKRYTKLYSYEDSIKMTISLRDFLLRLNSKKHVMKYLGNYLVGIFKAGGDKNDLGVNFVSRWWNRNLRIFRNLQRITESPDERILLIIGAGHLTVLRRLVLASPEYELVDVKRYLGYN